jgi:hypothetical protein
MICDDCGKPLGEQEPHYYGQDPTGAWNYYHPACVVTADKAEIERLRAALQTIVRDYDEGWDNDPPPIGSMAGTARAALQGSTDVKQEANDIALG